MTMSCKQTPSEIFSYKKTWVYVELEVTTHKDTIDYYYYGQMDQRILDRLAYNENYKSLFMLTDVRYHNNADKIQVYEDESDKGLLFFRTQDIVKMEVLKNDPLYDNKLKIKKDSLNSNN